MGRKTVLISGASRGIGKAIALEFAACGHSVMVNYVREQQKALNTAAEIEKAGGKAVLFRANVSNPEDVKKMVKEIEETEGKIDVLVNNAGICKDRSLLRLSDEGWDDVLKTDLYGPFFLLRECAQLMSKKMQGSIINIGSIAGLRGAQGASNYSTAKAGLIGLTKSAAKELGRFKITVNMVLPGFHLTDMGGRAPEKYIENTNRESVLEETTDIKELAQFIVFLSNVKTVSGQVFNWDSRII